MARLRPNPVAGACWLALLLCGLPAAVALLAAFRGAEGWTLANFARAWGDPARSLLLLRQTALIAGGAAAVALGLGAPLGFLVFRSDLPGRRWLAAGAVFAAACPFDLTAGCWLALAGGLQSGSWLAAAWVSGLAACPLALLVCGAAFAAADPELEDLARLDAGGWRAFSRVSLPQAAAGLAWAGFAVLALTAGTKAVTNVILVPTVAEEANRLLAAELAPGPAAAAALPLFLLFAAAGLPLLARGLPPVSLWGAGRAAPPLPLGRARLPLSLFALAAGAALVLLPLARLVLDAAGLAGFDDLARAARQGALAGPARELGRTLGETVRGCPSEILHTLILTPLCATLGLPLALAGAWTLKRASRRARALAGALLLLALAAPGVLVGLGLQRLLQGPLWAVGDSPAVLVLAWLARGLPCGILVLLPFIGRVPAELEDLARADGCGPLRRLWHLAGALNWGALVACWLLFFLLAAGELDATHAVQPPGYGTPLALLFFQRLHYGLAEAAGVGLVLLGLVVAPAALLAGLAGRGLKARLG